MPFIISPQQNGSYIMTSQAQAEPLIDPPADGAKARWLRRIPALVLAAAALAKLAGIAQANDAKTRFIHEAPNAWDDYGERAKRLQGTYSIKTNTLSPTKELAYHTQGKVMQTSRAWLAIEKSLLHPNSGHAAVTNSKYGFRLTQSQTDGSWVVGKIFAVDSADAQETQAHVSTWATCPVHLAIISDAISQRDLLAAAKSASSTQDGDKELITVRMEHRSLHPRIPSLSGSVTFDSHNYWVIRAFDFKFTLGKETNGSNVATFEYWQGADGFPILKRVARRLKYPVNRYDAEDEYEFNFMEAETPEKEFALSAFGFPEPKGIVWDDGGSRWYLGFAALAVASLAGGAYFRWRVRRRKIAAENARTNVPLDT